MRYLHNEKKFDVFSSIKFKKLSNFKNWWYEIKFNELIFFFHSQNNIHCVKEFTRENSITSMDFAEAKILAILSTNLDVLSVGELK